MPNKYPTPFVKVVCEGFAPRDVKVYLVDKDGTEKEISDRVNFVKWSCSAEDTEAKVELGIIPGQMELMGQLQSVIEYPNIEEWT